MNDVKGFFMLRSYYEAASKLADGDRLALYDAVMRYAFERSEDDMQPSISALFVLIKPTIDKGIQRLNSKYENGRKGGRPNNRTKTENNRTITDPKPKITESEPNHNHEYENEYENENEYEYEKAVPAPLDRGALNGNELDNQRTGKKTKRTRTGQIIL